MKRQYDFNPMERQREVLRIREMLEERMQGIQCDFAQYSTYDSGATSFTIFIYPLEKEFTPVEIAKLKGLLIDEFQFKSKSFSENYYYSWQRMFWEDDGTFYILRCLKNYIDGKADLSFRIENSPMLNCRVEKKTVEKTVYEAICE